MPRRLVPLSALFFVAACGSGGDGEDPAARAKLASDLVQCQNDRTALKEKLGDVQTELKKVKAENDPTQHLDAINAAPGEVQHHEGNLPPQAVMKVLKANAASLRACYERGLKRQPELRYVSTVNVHFSVRNSGNAGDVSYSPRTNAEMEECMSAAIGRWRFPTFSGDPVQFEAPVNLVAR